MKVKKIMSIVTAFSFEEVYVEIPTNVNRLVSRAQPFIGAIQIYQYYIPHSTASKEYERFCSV